MSDTNDMRRDFEAWMHAAGKGRANAEMFEVDANGDYVLTTIYATFYGYQVATQRATALERERCAVACDSICAGYVGIAAGLMGVIGKRSHQSMSAGAKICAAAIRQGGAHD